MQRDYCRTHLQMWPVEAGPMTFHKPVLAPYFSEKVTRNNFDLTALTRFFTYSTIQFATPRILGVCSISGSQNQYKYVSIMNLVSLCGKEETNLRWLSDRYSALFS